MSLRSCGTLLVGSSLISASSLARSAASWTRAEVGRGERQPRHRGRQGVGQGAVAAAGLRERQRADCLAFRVGLIGYRAGEGRGGVRRPSRSGSTRTLGAGGENDDSG